MSGGSLQHDAILAKEPSSSLSSKTGSSLWLARINDVVFKLSACALVLAALVLTFGVVVGHLTKRSMLWQDEVTIFLIAGAVFLSAASVQAVRGHIGIDLLDHWFPGLSKARRTVVDTVVLAFCVLFAWKTGLLLHEALAEGQTSHSAWGPPMWIPYSILMAGMVLLAVQVAFQVAEHSRLAVGVVLIAVAAFLLWQRSPAPLITGVPQWLIGITYCVATLVVMFSGMPIAFALGVVAVSFMILFMPAASVDTIAQNFYEELANVIILAIPLFILKGAAIGRSNAGKDLYSALHAWLHRIPGGLGVANTIACGLFAAMAGFCGNSGNARARLFPRLCCGYYRSGRHARHFTPAIGNDAALRCRGGGVPR
jgi:C4-dicarboxylate transporter, DctM subunit